MLGTQEACAIEAFHIIGITDIRIAHNAFTDALIVDTRPYRDDLAYSIGALDAREGKSAFPVTHPFFRNTKATLSALLGSTRCHSMVIPTGSGVDVGIVHTGGGNLD
ncbi:hypothetical protein D3C84_752700 [compost metagenome]